MLRHLSNYPGENMRLRAQELSRVSAKIAGTGPFITIGVMPLDREDRRLVIGSAVLVDGNLLDSWYIAEPQLIVDAGVALFGQNEAWEAAVLEELPIFCKIIQRDEPCSILAGLKEVAELRTFWVKAWECACDDLIVELQRRHQVAMDAIDRVLPCDCASVLEDRSVEPLDLSTNTWMDPPCVAICNAMNRFDGIQTISSCSGHEKEPFDVSFEVQLVADLAPLTWALAGRQQWSVQVVGTSRGHLPVFRLVGPVGPLAYDQADAIARRLCGILEEGVDKIIDELRIWEGEVLLRGMRGEERPIEEVLAGSTQK